MLLSKGKPVLSLLVEGILKMKTQTILECNLNSFDCFQWLEGKILYVAIYGAI